MKVELTKLSVICSESSIVEIKGQCYPCVVLIGRDEQLKRVMWRTKYFPHFYLQESDYIKIRSTPVYRSWHVQKVEGTQCRNLSKRVLTKVYVTDAGRIGESIKCINKMNKQDSFKEKTVFTYEADLSKPDLLALRFLIDKGIKSGVEINGRELGNPVDFIAPLRKWYIDFEAYTFKEYTSGLSPKDPFYMVSIWDSYDKKMYTYYTLNSKWSVVRQIEQKFIPFTEFPHEVKMFDTEAQMLDAMVILLIEKDPDVIAAWNLNRYDFPKWKQRMDFNKKNCLYKFSDISPMHSVLNTKPMRVKGRIAFDLMVSFKQFTDAEIESYSLGFIAENEELGYKKIPFKGSSGFTWDTAPDIAFQRNVLDVLIEKALDEKYELIELHNDLRTEFGGLFHETFIPYRIIDTALMRLVHGKVALKTTDYGKREEEKLLGAVVVSPEPDEYKNVFQFDFGREYPSIIKGFNISPETYRDKPTKNCNSIIYDWIDSKTKTNKHFEGYFDKSSIGLLCQLINFFFNKRNEYFKGYEKAIADKEPESVIKRWERRTYNIKKKTNAIYGVMDFPKFRLSKKECTQATAIMGRISIEELTEFLLSIGYSMLYGDTDSFFVNAHSSNKEALLTEGKELQKKLNEHLTYFFKEKYGVDAPAELGFKKIYSKIMFVEKKNYAGKSIWDEKKGWKEELDIKGIASVRSDSSMLEKSTIKEILKFALNGTSKAIIDNYVASILTQFDNKVFDPVTISYPAQIKKRLAQNDKGEWITGYTKTLPAHIKSAIYSNMFLNTDFLEGDKPRRLSIKPPKKLKLKKGQQGLFMDIPEPYPVEFTCQGKVRKLSDISITEDMNIPVWFINHIDYERIKKRLEGKVNKLLNIHYHIKESEDNENSV